MQIFKILIRQLEDTLLVLTIQEFCFSKSAASLVFLFKDQYKSLETDQIRTLTLQAKVLVDFFFLTCTAGNACMKLGQFHIREFVLIHQGGIVARRIHCSSKAIAMSLT
jgi:hypothetical protein